MEITNKDKKLLVYLLAIGIIAAAYFFGAKNFLDKQLELTEEIGKLETQVNHYTQIYTNRADYEARATEYEEQYESMKGKFFTGIDQESTIVMLKDIEKSTNVWFSRVSFQESEVLVGTASESENMEPMDAAQTEDTADVSEATSSLTGYRQDLSIDYSASYSDFKKFLDHVKNNDQRLYISAITASSATDSGRIAGTLTLSQYALEGTDIEKEDLDLSGIGLGVDNIFSSVSGGGAGISIGSVEADEADTEDNDSDENSDEEASDESEESEDSSREDRRPANEETTPQDNPAPAAGPSKPNGPAGGII